MSSINYYPLTIISQGNTNKVNVGFGTELNADFIVLYKDNKQFEAGLYAKSEVDGRHQLLISYLDMTKLMRAQSKITLITGNPDPITVEEGQALYKGGAKLTATELEAESPIWYALVAGKDEGAAATVQTVNGVSPDEAGNVDVEYSDLSGAPTLSTVATSGSYDDLADKPTIPTVPTLAPVATSGSYDDLIDKPIIPVIPTDLVKSVNSKTPNASGAVTVAAADIAGISNVGKDGLYSSLSGIPSTFTPAVHTHTASQVTDLSVVATSGSYNDLTNKPTIQSWVAMTQAEYDLLDPKDPDTLYLITE